MKTKHGKCDSLVRKFFLALRYPSSTFQRLEYHVGDFVSKRHMRRIHEYCRFIQSEKKAIERLSHVDAKTIDVAFTEFRDMRFSNYVDKALVSGYDLLKDGISMAGDIEPAERRILYVLCRVIKPMIVLETGVANGVSSAFILKALDENKIGLLYSVDLPSVALKAIFHRDSGWIIPKELRYRWKLILGKSSKVLPRLRLSGVDLFFHDSNHSYANMMFEFRSVWPFINSGGLLVCDGATGHDAFLDFSDSAGRTPIIIENTNFGAIRK